MAKKKTLTEAQIEKAYEIVRGFNIPDGEGEKRFEVKTKPQIVFEKDFEADVWKALVAGGAVAPLAEEVKEDEVIVFEKVGE